MACWPSALENNIAAQEKALLRAHSEWCEAHSRGANHVLVMEFSPPQTAQYLDRRPFWQVPSWGPRWTRRLLAVVAGYRHHCAKETGGSLPWLQESFWLSGLSHGHPGPWAPGCSKPNHLRLLHDQWRNHKRLISFGNIIAEQPIANCRGLPQGDPWSPAALCLLLPPPPAEKADGRCRRSALSRWQDHRGSRCSHAESCWEMLGQIGWSQSNGNTTR